MASSAGATSHTLLLSALKSETDMCSKRKIHTVYYTKTSKRMGGGIKYLINYFYIDYVEMIISFG